MRSDIDHYDGLTHWGPYDEQLLAPLLQRLAVPAGARVLDLGCGHGALLLALAKRYGVRVTGVDRSSAALELARASFAAEGLADSSAWMCRDADGLAFDGGTFDAIAWLGGPYLGDSHASTVQTLARWLKPGGLLLLGQGYWMAEPPQAYLDATGLPADALTFEQEMLAPVRDAGFEVLERAVSSRAAWDHFEGTLHRNHEAYADAHPDDPEVQAMIESKRTWQAAQERWGRDVFGFAVYLLRRS